MSIADRFGDRDTRDAYIERVDRIRRTTTIPYQVAPGAGQISTRRGWLSEGQEVRHEDLIPPDGIHPERYMRQLVAESRVVQADHVPRRVDGEIARVVPGSGGISTPRGILAGGDSILASDMSAESLQRFIAKGMAEYVGDDDGPQAA